MPAKPRFILLPGWSSPMLGLAAGGVLGLAGPAWANPLPTAAQILDTFNLVTTGNVSTSSDIEGSAVIGGTLSGSTFFNNNAPTDPVIDLYGSQSGSLNVNSGGTLYMSGTLGGQVNFNGTGSLYMTGALSGQVILNGGNLYLSGPLTGHVNYNDGSTLYTNNSTPLPPVSNYTAPLAQLFSQLAGLTGNSTITDQNNTTTFNAVAGSSGLAVFDVTASQLESELESNIAFSLGAGVTGVIVNVDTSAADNSGSTSFSEPGGINWNGPPLQDVLFNFTGASSVAVGNWEASILAPGANVGIENGDINGSVFAASFSGGGELHNYTYDGTLPDPTPVPEPATLGLFGLGLVGLAALRLRRR